MKKRFVARGNDGFLTIEEGLYDIIIYLYSQADCKTVEQNDAMVTLEGLFMKMNIICPPLYLCRIQYRKLDCIDIGVFFCTFTSTYDTMLLDIDSVKKNNLTAFEKESEYVQMEMSDMWITKF